MVTYAQTIKYAVDRRYNLKINKSGKNQKHLPFEVPPVELAPEAKHHNVTKTSSFKKSANPT